LEWYLQSLVVILRLFDNTSKNLRERILNELLEGKAVKDIKVKVAGQKNGQINIAPKENNKVVENNIADLSEFADDIKNIDSNDFYIVNEEGILENKERKYFEGNIKRRLAPGEVYLSITMASGKKFPLKLNVSRVNETQAEALYEIYKYRLNTEAGTSTLFEDLPDVIKNSIKEKLGTELSELANLMNESKERLTLKHIVDFYIWTGTSNKKTKVVVSQKNNSIFIGKNQITKENLDKEISRDTFVNFMTNSKNNNEGKRRHIQFKKTKGNRALNFENRKYVEYLINKGILNTNVNTKEDTFIGDTSIYLSTNLNTGTSKPKSTPKNLNLQKRN